MELPTGDALVDFFFKAFAVVLSFLYLIYAIVLYRQTQIMIRALRTGRGSLILFISLLQIIVAVILIVLALTII